MKLFLIESNINLSKFCVPQTTNFTALFQHLFGKLKTQIFLAERLYKFEVYKLLHLLSDIDNILTPTNSHSNKFGFNLILIQADFDSNKSNSNKFNLNKSNSNKSYSNKSNSNKSNLNKSNSNKSNSNKSNSNKLPHPRFVDSKKVKV
jgi:hypothetical protein